MRDPRDGLVSSLPSLLCPPPQALLPTCHGEAGPVALPRLPTVLVLGDAAVGREGVLFLHVRDVQPAVVSNKKPVFWRHNQDRVCYSLARATGGQVAYSQAGSIVQGGGGDGKTQGEASTASKAGIWGCHC